MEIKQGGESRLDKAEGFEILAQDPEANLGWRVILEFEPAAFAEAQIKQSGETKVRLVDILPADVKNRVLAELKAWTEETGKRTKEESGKEEEDHPLRIKMTSFEGAKGLSAQHVFILGMHEGELPRDAKKIKDIEICRLLVGLTRTKKKCSLLLTRRFADKWKQPSLFISWIKDERFQLIKVDAKYWKKK